MKKIIISALVVVLVIGAMVFVICKATSNTDEKSISCNDESVTETTPAISSVSDDAEQSSGLVEVTTIEDAAGKETDEVEVVIGVTGDPKAPADWKPTETHTQKQEGVYVALVYQNSYGDKLPESKEKQVRKIFSKYKFDSPSWDNINYYNIRIDGTSYYYDHYNGIITKDDTHATRLSDSDRNTLNKIIGANDMMEVYGDAAIITDTFIIKEINGTVLTLARYDRNNGEYKEGLYTCNYGGFAGSADMHFNKGDVVTIRYNSEVAETYPMQMTIYEIYPAVWN